MAEATDAARDRVLATRSELADELQRLEASVREAVDIPAKIRRSPAKAAAVVGGIGFLALKGPQRVVGLGRRVVRGKSAPMPKSMLPDEIEKTLRELGNDGDQVRGTLERDFAALPQGSDQRARQLRNLFLLERRPAVAASGARRPPRSSLSPRTRPATRRAWTRSADARNVPRPRRRTPPGSRSAGNPPRRLTRRRPSSRTRIRGRSDVP